MNKNINYNNLKKYTIEYPEIFFSKIEEYKGYTIEHFSYRLASFEDFNEKEKLEMRWIAFIYWNEIKEPKLFTIGFHKFFNYWEWDTIDNIWKEKIESITNKLDGSLIMVWKMPDWEIIAKTKTTIFNDQSIKSKYIIDNNPNLKKFINDLIDKWLYPLFEYIWIDNKIVVTYPERDLTLLAIRDSLTWEYLEFEDVISIYEEYQVETGITQFYNLTLDEVLNKKEFDEWYEWFVINYKNGNKLKVKLNSYVELHYKRDSLNNIKKMANMVLDEDLDDLRWVYEKDKIVLSYINIVEKVILTIYREFILKVENIFEETKHMDRKEFAIYHKQNNQKVFPILMDWYNKNEMFKIYNQNKEKIDKIFEETKYLDKKKFLSYHRTNNKEYYSVLSYLYFNYDFDIKDFFLKEYLDYNNLENKINNLLV